MKMTYILTTAILCLLVSSCKDETKTDNKIVGIKDSKSISNDQGKAIEIKGNESATIAKQRVVEFNSDFSNIEEFKNNLNKFIIHVEVNSGQGQSVINCETQSSPHDKKKFQKQLAEQSSGTDLLVDLNDITSQKETLKCTIESDKSTLLVASFEIKKDLLLSQSGDLNRNILAGENQFGALVLADGVVLETLGTNFTLKAEQLISSEASITTFPGDQNTNALNNRDGQSGGILNINATQAFGRLSIHMIGQNGGQVTDVPKKVEERPTVDASYNGLPLITEWFETCDDRGDRIQCFGETVASQCPTDGKKGIRGFKGRNGFDGRLGGNSGVANVYIADGTNFNLDVKLLNGAGSLAGAPGEGGPGSLGGSAGSYDTAFINRCSNRVPSAGPAGEVGEIGEVGATGKNGAIERASYIDLKNNVKIEY